MLILKSIWLTPGRMPGIAIVCLGLCLGSRAGAAIDLASADRAAGSYEITLQDTERRCTLLLRRDEVGPGRRIAMPAGCRRALPVLTDAGTWTLSKSREITFADRDGAPVLTFAGENAGALFATGPEGETYQLYLADDRQRVAQALQTGPSKPASGFREVPASGAPATKGVEVALTGTAPKPKPLPATPSTAPTPGAEPQGGPVVAFNGRPDDLSGRYIILREGSKDVGCMLTLDDKARGAGGGLKAQLAPACRDQGIVVFDPVGWRFERGRLVLTARKGHQATFDWHADGAWWKDPKEGGKPLGVKRL